MKVIILRGIPGCGKTTYRKTHWPKAPVCSADNFFINERGAYDFDPRKLEHAHQCCLQVFAGFVVGYRNLPCKPDVLVVDNTNIFAWEVAPYYLLASAYGFQVEVHTLHCDPKVAARRCLHCVPLKTIEEMYRGLGAGLPHEWKKIDVTLHPST